MKILLSISHALHDRNFVASGLCEVLRQRGHQVTVFRPLPHFQRLRAFLRLGSLVARERESRTYRFKLAQKGRPQGQIAAWRAYRRVGDPEALAARIEAALPPSRASRAVLGGVLPDLVLVPTMIHMDAWDNDLINSARRDRIPVVAAPASFDTLTTKGGFLVRPDGVLVWGEASRRHAIGTHGFPPEQVAVTGPPHFDMYAEPRAAWPPSLVLVAGTTVNFWADELELVEFLRRHLNESQAKVLHRPHPRQGQGWSWLRQVQLRGQLDSAWCIVAAFSTVVIEAALLGKPSLLVGFGKSAHGPGGTAYHAELEHMAEVASWPGVMLCRSQKMLLDGLQGILGGVRPSLPAELRRCAQEVARSDGHARERIVEAVESFADRGHF